MIGYHPFFFTIISFMICFTCLGGVPDVGHGSCRDGGWNAGGGWIFQRVWMMLSVEKKN